MTHKDYVKLAKALAEARALFNGPTVEDASARAGINYVERNIADVLAADNPRFDRERFHAAAIGHPQTGRDQL